jgi:hypothetical protein
MMHTIALKAAKKNSSTRHFFNLNYYPEDFHLSHTGITIQQARQPVRCSEAEILSSRREAAC